MKPELTQEELQIYTNAGKTMIWQYNTLYQIDYSRNIGNGEYYMRQIVRKNDPNMGVTRRGRFIAMTPEHAAKFL